MAHWLPPAEMLQRQPYLPRFMAGGPGNPLGARAMYLSGSVYRISTRIVIHMASRSWRAGIIRGWSRSPYAARVDTPLRVRRILPGEHLNLVAAEQIRSGLVRPRPQG